MENWQFADVAKKSVKKKWDFEQEIIRLCGAHRALQLRKNQFKMGRGPNSLLPPLPPLQWQRWRPLSSSHLRGGGLIVPVALVALAHRPVRLTTLLWRRRPQVHVAQLQGAARRVRKVLNVCIDERRRRSRPLTSLHCSVLTVSRCTCMCYGYTFQCHHAIMPQA